MGEFSQTSNITDQVFFFPKAINVTYKCTDTCFLKEAFHRFLCCSNGMQRGDLQTASYPEHACIEAKVIAGKSTERQLLFMAC